VYAKHSACKCGRASGHMHSCVLAAESCGVAKARLASHGLRVALCTIAEGHVTARHAPPAVTQSCTRSARKHTWCTQTHVVHANTRGARNTWGARKHTWCTQTHGVHENTRGAHNTCILCAGFVAGFPQLLLLAHVLSIKRDGHVWQRVACRKVPANAGLNR
jgi:hypothetical protein